MGAKKEAKRAKAEEKARRKALRRAKRVAEEAREKKRVTKSGEARPSTRPGGPSKGWGADPHELLAAGPDFSLDGFAPNATPGWNDGEEGAQDARAPQRGFLRTPGATLRRFKRG